jgi:hypothetical protein
MFRRNLIRHSPLPARRLGLEWLETRRVMDCHGLDSFGLCVAGDSDENGQFDQDDLVHVLQAGKYLTGEAAQWREGDWNGDGLFNALDITRALQAGTYQQGVLVDDLSALIASVPADPMGFTPPVVISSQQQLVRAVPDQAAREAIAKATDWDRQQLLMFSWSGSGQDRLVAEPEVVGGRTRVEFRFRFGLTDDYRPHQVLLAVPQDANWDIEIDGATVHSDTLDYSFLTDTSRLVVTGGLAGVRDEYRIEGSVELSRKNDGRAAFILVDAVLRGDGLSGLDGQPLDDVLNLTALSGLQVWDSSVVFAGWDPAGETVVKLQLFGQQETWTIAGGNIPPCCDFFQYQMDATATASGE